MENDYSVERPKIGKLTGPNYRPWSVQVQRLLLSQGLWNVVLKGSVSTEATGGPTDTTEDTASLSDRTEVKDAKASTIIMGLCATEPLQNILLLETAKEQWEALKALYRPLGLRQLHQRITRRSIFPLLPFSSFSFSCFLLRKHTTFHIAYRI